MTAVLGKVDDVTELFYGGSWHDITATADVYARDPIVITRGLPDLSPQTPPSQCSLSIENNDGKYSPRNPGSSLFGLIGRNTPLRQSVRMVRATFSTNATDSWPVTDTGESWSTAWVGGSGADFDAAAGVGTMIVSGASQYRLAYLTDIARNRYPLQEVAITCTLSAADITGGQVEPANILLRLNSINDYYMVRVEIQPSEVVTLKLLKIVAGVETTMAGPVTCPFTHTGQAIRVKGLAEGNSLWCKAWPVSSGEPYGWQLSVTDNTFATGLPGVRNGVGAGNTNVPLTFSCDDFEVRLPRFIGEVESWPQVWNLDDSDVWAPIKAYGLLRRYSAPGVAYPAESALRRAHLRGVMRFGLLAYWPFEEGVEANTGASLVTGVPAVTLTSAVTPGAVSEPQVGSAPYAAVSNAAPAFTPRLLPTSTAGFFSFSAVIKGTMPRPGSAKAVIYNPMLVTFSTGNISSVQLSAYAKWTGTAFDTSNTGLDAIVLGGTSFGSVLAGVNVNLFDGNPHDIQVRLVQNGADVVGTLWVDGVQVAGATSTTKTLGIPGKFYGPVAASGSLGGTTVDNTDTEFGFGHYSIHNNSLVFNPHGPATGHAGETAGVRLNRLTGEDGLNFALRGDQNDTEPMGPQRVAPFLDLLTDCADADGGILFEPRGVFGLAYATVASFYNASATATLNYAGGGEVGRADATLTPVDDTDTVTNDVTVTRYLGSSSRAIKSSGTLNVNEPAVDPNGVGRIPTNPTLVLADDAQTFQQAAWRRHLGTWDESRYPVVPFDHTAMLAAGKPELINQTAALDCGGRFAITNPPAWLPREDIDQMPRGFTETIETHHWFTDINAVPARPYAVGTMDGPARLDCLGSTLTAGISAGDTGFTVTVTDGCLWSTTGTPYGINIEGDLMTVTAVSGASSPQTFTVTRTSTARAHLAGASVRVAKPIRLTR